MPISSRRIIALIRDLPSSFPYSDIEKSLIKSDKSPGKKSKRKKKITGSHKDREKINTIIHALIQAGFLEKKKKTFHKPGPFILEGTISIKRSGNAVLIDDYGMETVIKSEFLRNARDNDYVSAEIIDYRKGYFFVQVKEVLRRKKEKYTASVINVSNRYIFLSISDSPVRIEVCSDKENLEPQIGYFAVVELLNSELNGLPEARILKLYSSLDEDYDIERIIIKHALPAPHGKYRELEKLNGNFFMAAKKGRKDFTHLETITIDGINAKDFDDAISLVKDDHYRKLYVHIADVSSHLDKGTPLDKEAAKRGTSFYLGNTVIPMLPEKLSNELCSLKEGEERLTVSVEIVFDSDGMYKEHSFHESVIKSGKRLTYDESHNLIEKDDNSPLSQSLLEMYDLAIQLKTKRLSNGRVDLNLTDSELIFDGNTLVDLIEAKRLKSHLIIEEFMLTANELVSRTLKERAIPTLYRIHENINLEKLDALLKFLHSLGLTINTSKNLGNALQEIIRTVDGKEYEEVVNFIILKSLMQAYYGVEPLGHFGLGFQDYTHFTSPIRRYPDLIVHRCLKSIIREEAFPYNTEELIPIGEKSSEMERVAQNAERDLFKLKACRIMKDRIGESFEAIISGIAKSGFFVMLMERPIEGMVPLRSLTDDYYLVNEDEYTVIGKRLGRRFRLGDKISIRLTQVELETMRIDFEVI